jgi:hypothetical protein
LGVVDARERRMRKFASGVEVILSRWLPMVLYLTSNAPPPASAAQEGFPSDHAGGVAGFRPVKKNLFPVRRPFSLAYSTYALV